MKITAVKKLSLQNIAVLIRKYVTISTTFFDKKRFQSIPGHVYLCIVLVCMLLVETFLLFSPLQSTMNKVLREAEPDANRIERYASESKQLFAEGTNRNLSGIRLVNKVSKPFVRNSLTSTVKTMPRTPHQPEITITSTVAESAEGRDIDRTIILQEMLGILTEYALTYHELPFLYSNKSGSQVSDTPVSVVYFYNEIRNRTNAVALNLKADTESYVLKNTPSCQDYSSEPRTIAFVYEDEFLTGCYETKSADTMWIPN